MMDLFVRSVYSWGRREANKEGRRERGGRERGEEGKNGEHGQNKLFTEMRSLSAMKKKLLLL